MLLPHAACGVTASHPAWRSSVILFADVSQPTFMVRTVPDAIVGNSGKSSVAEPSRGMPRSPSFMSTPGRKQPANVRDIIKALHADYKRHQSRWSNPSVWILAVYRYGQWAQTLPQPARRVADRLYHAAMLGVQITTGSFIPREVEIGEALHLVHHFDIRIHPDVKIGNRVGIMHEVTIATTRNRRGAPVIGDDVFIGAGAKIVGPVKIGAGANIAPNSLVMASVPAGATAIGVPAKTLRVNAPSVPKPRLTPEPAESPEAVVEAPPTPASAATTKAS